MAKSRAMLALAILAVLMVISVGATAREMVIPSTDRIAVGDWTYIAMGKLAADGLVPLPRLRCEVREELAYW